MTSQPGLIENVMQFVRLGLLIIVTSCQAFAVELEDLRKQSKSKTDQVLDESNKKREKLLARFAEFQKDLEQLKPGLGIQMPVEGRNAAKIRLVDHNELTGIPEAKKVYAIVTQQYKLKTWHSESDSQNLDTVKPGDKVEVLLMVNTREANAPKFGWVMVRTASGSEGYIPQMYLKNIPEQATVSTAKKEKKYVFITTGLRMRSEPTLAGEFIALVPADAEVDVLRYSKSKDTVDGLKDFWAEISYGGRTGWVFNGYLRAVGQKPPPEPPSVNAGGFTVPVDGRVSSKFGPRIDPVTKKSGDFHRGIDIVAPVGEPIKAAKDGDVFESSTNKWWGHYIIIKHSGDVYTYYCHQSRKKSAKGQKVKTGEVIGYVGKTGKVTGPHLHFEVRSGKDPKDPLQYLK